jgi:hypothetical protein
MMKLPILWLRRLAFGKTHIILNNFQKVDSNSNILKVIPGRKYVITTEVRGISGKSYSAYFGVVFIRDGVEVDRKIRWLNDFSNTKKKFRLIFEAKTENVILVYRINNETPIRSDCEFILLPIDKVNFTETESSVEDYDNVNDFIATRTYELTFDEELMLEKNIVWVFGFYRSGTTWLGTQLLSYNTHIMPEPGINEHLGIHWETNDDVVRKFDRHYDEPSYFFSKRYEDVWKYYLRKLILHRIYYQFSDLEHKIIIKEPALVGGFDIISRCLPNSKIIFLIRDGRDIVDSHLDSFLPDSWGSNEFGIMVDENSRIPIITNIAKKWVKLNKILLKTFENHPVENRIMINYENLRQNTADELQKLYSFIGLDIKREIVEHISNEFSFENIPSELKGRGKFNRFATPGMWKEHFSPSEKLLMDEIMGKMLHSLGYN